MNTQNQNGNSGQWIPPAMPGQQMPMGQGPIPGQQMAGQWTPPPAMPGQQMPMGQMGTIPGQQMAGQWTPPSAMPGQQMPMGQMGTIPGQQMAGQWTPPPAMSGQQMPMGQMGTIPNQQMAGQWTPPPAMPGQQMPMGQGQIPAQAIPMEPSQPVVPIGIFGRSDNFNSRIKVPAHNLKFDENYFLKLLASSISLSKDEKKRIIESIPKLSQYQIDELVKIFEEEKRKFSELDVKHKEQLQSLEAKHAAEWEAIEMEQEQSNAQDEENSAADDIRKSLGIDD